MNQPLSKPQSRTPSAIRYERVQTIMEADLLLKTKLGPKDHAVVSRSGENLMLSKEAVDITNAIHAKGLDAHKICKNDVLRAAADLLNLKTVRVEATVGSPLSATCLTEPVALPSHGAPTTTLLKLCEIKLDPAMQCRVSLNQKAIAEYTERMKAGDRFPPLDVFDIEGMYPLVDGWHRCFAAKEAGLESFQVQIHQGTRKDAIRFAIEANGSHGLRVTNRDKQRFVLIALEQFGDLSDHLIAGMCRVSQPFVSRLRSKSQLKTVISCRTGKDGRKRRLPHSRGSSGPTKQTSTAREEITDSSTAERVNDHPGESNASSAPPSDNRTGSLAASEASCDAQDGCEQSSQQGQYKRPPDLNKIQRIAGRVWRQVELQARKLRKDEQHLFWKEIEDLQKTRSSFGL